MVISKVAAPEVYADFGTVDGEFFSDSMTDYVREMALVDALVKSCDPEQSINTALSVISRLKHMADNGAGYSPPASLGLGSDNAATISNRILGRSKSLSALKKVIKSAFKVG